MFNKALSPEEARARTLAMNKQLDGIISSEPGERGEIKTTINLLKASLNFYSDEIPDHEVHEGALKVRTNWWSGPVGCFETILDFQPLIHDEILSAKMHKWIDDVKARYKGQSKHETTRDEINEAEVLIREVIEYLQKRLEE